MKGKTRRSTKDGNGLNGFFLLLSFLLFLRKSFPFLRQAGKSRGTAQLAWKNEHFFAINYMFKFFKWIILRSFVPVRLF